MILYLVRLDVHTLFEIKRLVHRKDQRFCAFPMNVSYVFMRSLISFPNIAFEKILIFIPQGTTVTSDANDSLIASLHHGITINYV